MEQKAYGPGTAIKRRVQKVEVFRREASVNVGLRCAKEESRAGHPSSSHRFGVRNH